VTRLTKGNLKEIIAVSRSIKKSGLPKNLVCKKLPGGLGYGIFLHPTAKPILKGQVIAPYAGEVSLSPQNLSELSSDSEYVFCLIQDIRLTKKEQFLIGDGLCYRPSRVYSFDLDGEKKGNFTRFINHSKRANVDAILSRLPSRTLQPLEIIYIANKTIRPGQQLLVNYEGEEKAYWGKVKPAPITPSTFRLKKESLTRSMTL